MSVNAIEKALWQASRNPAQARRLREDAQSYLQDFRVDDDERALMLSWNISGMLARGVHPQVLMLTFAAVNGVEATLGYVERIHQPHQAASTP